MFALHLLSNNRWLAGLCAAMSLACGICRGGESEITAAAFADKAIPALPIESPNDFARVLTAGTEPVKRNSSASPTNTEFLLPSQGWQVVLPATSGVVLRQAAETFQETLYRSMDVQLTVNFRSSLSDWAVIRQAIIVGSAKALPDCAAKLVNPKDYRILITNEQIVVCGFEEPGAMYGLYNLLARMTLREAPIVPLRLDTSRHSLYQTRMTLSGLGWMEGPDAYLSLLSQYGFDAIYASDYANPTRAAPPPLYSFMKRQNPEQMRD